MQAWLQRVSTCYTILEWYDVPGSVEPRDLHMGMVLLCKVYTHCDIFKLNIPELIIFVPRFHTNACSSEFIKYTCFKYIIV